MVLTTAVFSYIVTVLHVSPESRDDDNKREIHIYLHRDFISLL